MNDDERRATATVIDADRLAAAWRRAQAAANADYDERMTAADAITPAAAPPAAHAREINDDEFLIAVAAVVALGRGWATFYELEIVFPDTPWKVLRSKLRRLMGRDLVMGCDCGCRGDVELLEDGVVRLRELAAALASAGVRLPMPAVMLIEEGEGT